MNDETITITLDADLGMKLADFLEENGQQVSDEIGEQHDSAIETLISDLRGA